jgi:hypothetical protein
VRVLNRFYAVVSWGIVALGALHMITTLRLSASSATFRLWFFGSGIAMALVGALNLLHRAYGRFAFGVRVVCWAANVLLTAFAFAAGAVTHPSVAEYILIMSLVGAALLLSFLPLAVVDDAKV